MWDIITCWHVLRKPQIPFLRSSILKLFSGRMSLTRPTWGIAFDGPYLKPPFLKYCICPRNHEQIWACGLPLGIRLSHQLQLALANHSLLVAFSVKCTACLNANLSVAVASSYVYCTPVWCYVNVPVLYEKISLPIPFLVPIFSLVGHHLVDPKLLFDNVMAKFMTHQKTDFNLLNVYRRFYGSRAILSGPAGGVVSLKHSI